MVEEHPGYAELELKAEGLKLASLYRELAVLQEGMGLLQFAVSQTTLEHVFVNMARLQE